VEYGIPCVNLPLDGFSNSATPAKTESARFGFTWRIPAQGMLLLFGFVGAASWLHAFSRSGHVFTTNGTQYDVTAAIAQARRGDTVMLPAGSFSWGGRESSVYLNKEITLAGAGIGKTTIILSSNGPMWGSGVISIKAACTVRDFTVQGTNRPVTAFSTDTASGWRITHIRYLGGLAGAYFCYAGNVYGLIDHCELRGEVGNAELIFARGPIDSWQTPSSVGRPENVFVEDCTFAGQGYVCDANSNARVVVRFCRIDGPMKVDGHGVASNSPARGVRHMEIYDNTWTTTEPFNPGIELRGGSGYVFDNTSVNLPGTKLWFILTDYGYTAQWPNFGGELQTPFNYPLADQIGVGMDPKAAASEPMYLWNNRAAGQDWAFSWKDIPSAAIDRYRAQTARPAATFQMQDVIMADRDFFKGTVGVEFSGAGGVGWGTKAQMAQFHPSKLGVAFWVTDEGKWNATHDGLDGCLYQWNGAAWVLFYTPYSYPHPLQQSASGLH
jgi:hypothetical protein